MNNFQKLSVFLLGSSLGGLVAYLYLTKKYDKIIEEEVASIRAAYGRTTNIDNSKPDEKQPTISSSSDNSSSIEEPYNYHEDKPFDPDDYIINEDEVDEAIKENEKEQEKAKKIAQKYNYSAITKTPITNAQNEELNSSEPYTVGPDEFGAEDDYATIGMTYFEEDKVLTDDDYVEVTDIEGTVGYDALNSFGEFEDDTVYVRNDRLKTYFEILANAGSYKEVIGNKPREVNF